MPQGKAQEKSGVYINRDACMGCTICTKKYPQLFQMDRKKANVKEYSNLDMELLDSAIKSCPVKAIEYN